MKQPWWLAAIVVLATLVAGCQNNGHAQNSTDMRTLNAVVDAEPLDVLVEDDVKQAAVSLGTTSPYSEFSSGSKDVKIRSSTLGTVLVEKTVSFSSGTHGTMVIYGKRAAIQSLLLADDTTSPSSDKFKVRVAGFSSDAGALDVYLANSDISSSPATIPGIGFNTVTDYSEIANGSYRIVFTVAGTKDVVFQSDAISFASGAMVTIGVFPAIGGKLVNAVMLTAGGNAAGTYIPNPLVRLKAVNATPDSPPLNFKADATTLLSSVPFAGSSSYVTTATGTRSLAVEAASAPGASLASLVQSLSPARDYTVIAINMLSGIQLVALADDNTTPGTSFAKIRFVNVLTDSSSVDVLVNFASQAPGLAYRAASSYYSFASGNTYTITFATPGGITVIATILSEELVGGAVYTAYLLGTSASPQVRLVRDR